MNFVLDCSVAASFLLPDEQDPMAVRVLESFEVLEAVVPVLFFWELGSVLNVSKKRKRLTNEIIQKIIHDVRILPIMIDTTPDFFELNELLALSSKYNLSVYEATYLRTAKKFNIPLLSLDEALTEAARKEGLPEDMRFNKKSDRKK